MNRHTQNITQKKKKSAHDYFHTETPLRIDASYKNSTIIQTLVSRHKKRLPLRIACLDIDYTITGAVEQTNAARALLEKQGYVVVFVTNRTEEMLMSKSSYDKSVVLGFARPQPHLGRQDGKNYYIPPEDAEPIGILDADCIGGSTGTQIAVKQVGGGYMVDNTYSKSFGQEALIWRAKTLELLSFIDPHNTLFYFEKIDNDENYANNTTNIYPPNYRIQIGFADVLKKATFLDKIAMLSKETSAQLPIREQLRNVLFTEDSHPLENSYGIHATPKNAYKHFAVEQILYNVCALTNIPRKDFHILFAGDSLPDLSMGFYSGTGAKTTFLLVGGSRLTHVLTSPDEHTFASVDVSNIKQELHTTRRSGFYQFNGYKNDRIIIIGNEAYPKTQAVETVLAYLQEH